MTRDQVRSLIAPHLDELHRLGVRSLEVFGSVARGESRATSDVDLLVDFVEVPGVLGFLSLKHRLEDLLGAPVDLVMRSTLKARIRDQVLREALRVA